jgi:NAD-dependent DNA ligase
MGLILAALLGASADERADSTEVKGLQCSPDLKAVIQRAIGDRRKRYVDAAAMLAAIETRRNNARGRAALPTSLKGKYAVFTGALSIPRREAASLVRRRGGHVQAKVTSLTEIIVQGATAKMWKADLKGQKLLDVDRERERGHDLCVIGEREFLMLVGRPPHRYRA